MSLGRLISDLHALRADFAPSADARRMALLARLARARPRRARDVEAAHDELLFLAAFPPSRTIWRRTVELLDAFASWNSALGPRARQALDDTGIAGSATTGALPWSCAQWLRAREQEVTLLIDDDATAARLEPLARAAITPAEEDHFDAGAWGAREYLLKRSAGHPFRWLIPADGPKDRARAAAFEASGVPLSWSLGASPWSATRNRVPTSTPVLRRSFRRLPVDVVQHIATPLRGIRRLHASEAAVWMAASMAALAARAREVTPTMDSNPDEIYLADLGHGATLCVLGTHRERRCALEANYGYVMFSNGVPIGYGGVTPLANQANTGANLFPAFRGSEAAFLFAQSLRAFRTLFGVSRFIVNPYQFGADNDEALASGAFWFYDRLGFRSVRPALRALASRERDRLRHARGSRSPRPVLRRLATADLVLELESSPVALFPEDHLVTLGQRVALRLARESAATGPAAATGRTRNGGAAAREGTRLLGPLLLLIDHDIRRWSRRERDALTAIVRAKGGRRERAFVALARQHPRLWRALDAAARAKPTSSRR